nr:energy transducer TonB [Rhodopseudomonas sp. WA056]
MLGWSVSALLMMGAHAGAVVWMLRVDPVVPADDSAPAAIMLDMAAVPEAMATATTEISPDLKSADDSRPQSEQQHEPQPQHAELVEPNEHEPVEQPKTEHETPVVETAEVPLPRPEPPPTVAPPQHKPTPNKKQRPRPQRAAANSQAMRQAQLEARQSERLAAAQTAFGGMSQSPAEWRSRLMAHLQRNKRSVSAAMDQRARRIAYVRFAIDQAGNVGSVSLVRSSGLAEIDREAVALVRRASPVPPPPAGVSPSLTVPVGFASD